MKKKYFITIVFSLLVVFFLILFIIMYLKGKHTIETQVESKQTVKEMETELQKNAPPVTAETITKVKEMEKALTDMDKKTLQGTSTKKIDQRTLDVHNQELIQKAAEMTKALNGLQ